MSVIKSTTSSAIREIAYCDTLGIGLALVERCPRLEGRLKSDAAKLYVERDPAERLRPGIVVGGKLYARRIRIQRPGPETLEAVRRLIERGRAVATRIDLARDAIVSSLDEADAVLAAVAARVVLRWCSTRLRVVGDGWYLGLSDPGEEGAVLVGYAGPKAAAKHSDARGVAHVELRLHGTRVVAAAVGTTLTRLDLAWDRVRVHARPSVEAVVDAISRRSPSDPARVRRVVARAIQNETGEAPRAADVSAFLIGHGIEPRAVLGRGEAFLAPRKVGMSDSCESSALGRIAAQVIERHTPCDTRAHSHRLPTFQLTTTAKEHVA